MKRPSGLWILLSAGVLWLSLQDVYGIRATALIFGKSTTSTTTEATSSVSAEARIDEETATITEATASENSTASKNSTLTGIPQIDYLMDPNLPQILNGYNLSEYPFYERVPVNIEKEIDFKCDGLHDGFYASIPHKCQVYHHCLFGTRYDFLCANYTAFDQKTFICQFVSEVDCVNSKDFWHRNDALYEAASTTTIAPLRANIYTTAPPGGGEPITPRRPAGSRRPYRTRLRRPQVEYYDDEYYDDEYYDERPRATRGRKRPRPRPRPVYDDEDEEYEDERYESRRGGGRKRPYRKRTRDRKRPEYEDEDEQVDDKFEDEDFIAANKRQKNESKRKPPIDDEVEVRDQRRPSGKRRYPNEQREQEDDYDRKPPRKSSTNKRPTNDEYEDELPQSDDSRTYEQRPRKKPKGNSEESSDGRPIIKPTSGTIYDRPRVAPRINLPVPKNAADKFAFKPIGGAKATTTTKATPPADEEEYLDEEYEEPVPKRQKTRNRRPSSDNQREKPKVDESRDQPSESRHRVRKPEVEEIVEKSTTTTVRPKYSSGRGRYPRPTQPSKKIPVSEEYYDEEEYLDEEKEVQDRKPNHQRRPTSTTSTSTTTTTTTTTTPSPKKEKYEPVMRIIKRPFLPSRGGSPYSRGLQPVGLKAVDKTSEENDSREVRDEEKEVVDNKEESDYYDDSDKVEEQPTREPQEDVQNVRKPYFKPSPVLVKVPLRQKYAPPTAEAQELIESEPSYQQNYKSRDHSNSRTTLKPKVVEKNPLDLNEYDVTLNDALNPTLPNLPVRSFPTGFSSGNDYGYNTFTRPRYVLEPIVSPSNQNYVHPNKVVRSHQRHEAVPQSQYSTINGGYRQHGQTQALYSGY